MSKTSHHKKYDFSFPLSTVQLVISITLIVCILLHHSMALYLSPINTGFPL